MSLRLPGLMLPQFFADPYCLFPNYQLASVRTRNLPQYCLGSTAVETVSYPNYEAMTTPFSFLDCFVFNFAREGLWLRYRGLRG